MKYDDALTSEAEAAVLSEVPNGCLVNGELIESESGRVVHVEDPATGDVLAAVPDIAPHEAIVALDAAVAAQASWARTPKAVRRDLLLHAYQAVMDAEEELALLITLEMGKPFEESRLEVGYAADFLRWFSEETIRSDGRYSDDPRGSGRILTRNHPVGPCLLITPWNFPLAMVTRKVAPAVAAGCTMVLKPAPQSPLTALRFARLMSEVGLPHGVLNVITTSQAPGVVEVLLADGRLRKLSFTGSTEVGRRLLANAAARVTRCSMELGGNAPLIVFDDADLELAVDGAVLAKTRNGGESCTAANRIYVQQAVSEEFTEAFTKRMIGLRLGRGTAKVDVGPMIDEAARGRINELVDDAVAKGADVLAGGNAVEGPGYFFTPTVLRSVPTHARMVNEEIFGPVAPVQTFMDEREAVHLANATDAGLVSYVFTQNLDRALRLSDELDTGMVGLNQGVVSNAAAPFGGVKQSGIGREGGPEGMCDYQTLKYIALAGAPSGPEMGWAGSNAG